MMEIESRSGGIKGCCCCCSSTPGGSRADENSQTLLCHSFSSREVEIKQLSMRLVVEWVMDCDRDERFSKDDAFS